MTHAMVALEDTPNACNKKEQKSVAQLTNFLFGALQV